MISVYAYHMCSVLFLPVQSLLMCFRSSLTCFADLSLITLRQTLRLFYVSLRSQAPKQQYTVHCMHYSITLWAYLSELHVKDNQTLPLRTCYREVYGNILYVKKMADLVVVTYVHNTSNLELSSFRENGFLVLLHFPRCSRS